MCRSVGRKCFTFSVLCRFKIYRFILSHPPHCRSGSEEMAGSAELYTWDSENPKSSSAKKGPLDAVGVQVDVCDVCYSVWITGEEKKLLQHVSFHLEPGDMCALMGASGAGKR
jgi:ABC-type multidrug transport system fused ATPase/permease subunit